MKKLLFALSFASSFAFMSNAADWFSGSVGNAVNGAWSGTDAEGVAAVGTSYYELDTDSDVYLTFTPDQSKTPDTNSTDTVVINAAFTPSALSALAAPPSDAQTAFVAAYDGDPAVTNYYVYVNGAWVALSGATPAAAETLVTLKIEFDYSGSIVKTRFYIGDTVLTGTAADGSNWFLLTGKSQKTITSIACSGTGRLASVAGAILVKTHNIVIDGASLPDAETYPAFATFLADAGYDNLSAAALKTALETKIAGTDVEAWQCYALGLGNPSSLTASEVESKLAVTAASADTATDSLKIAVPKLTAGDGYSVKYRVIKIDGGSEETISETPNGSGALTLPLPETNGVRYRVDIVIVQEAALPV